MRKIGKSANQQLREHQLKMLAGILALAKGEGEILSVLNTVMTLSEKAAIAQRAAILFKISKGIKYFEIEGMYGVSSTTITKAVDQYIKNYKDSQVLEGIMEQYIESKLIYKSKYKKIDPLEIATKDEYKVLKQLRR